MTDWNISAGANAGIVNGLPGGVDNDQGTIRGAGNVGTTGKFSADAVSLGQSRNITVVSGLSDGITGATAGAFNSGIQVIRRVTNSIAGVSNNTLQSGASDSANRPFSVNQVTVVNTFNYKTAIRNNDWNEFSGSFDAIGVGNTGVWDQTGEVDVAGTVSQSGTDHAANPSQATPGEFVYRNGSPAPVQADYPAHTNW